MEYSNMEYMTEADALQEIGEVRNDYDDIIDGGYYQEFLEDRAESIAEDWTQYSANKNAKIGEIILCAENRCNKRFKKEWRQQAFCCTKHKNQFWNRQKLIN